MTALQTLIAEVLDHHAIESLDEFNAIAECSCALEMDESEHAAHQAAVVEAALMEAGTVEWGALTLGRKVPYRYAKEVDARNSARANREGKLVSRLTLPWERAE